MKSSKIKFKTKIWRINRFKLIYHNMNASIFQNNKTNDQQLLD